MPAKQYKTQYGYPSVESLVLAFVKASHLAPKNSSTYTDVRELAKGKRRFFSQPSALEKKANADDFPGIAKKLEETLAANWATPEMAAAISARLERHIRMYLSAYVLRISSAQCLTSEIMANIRLFYFAQLFAVDLSWLEQKWGIGLLHKLLPRNGCEANPIGTTLKWIRRLESLSAADAISQAGYENGELEKQLYRWENGHKKPRQDSFPLIKAVYGMDNNPRYRLWFWIALLLDNCPPEFRQEITACLGHSFDLEQACESFIQQSNHTILTTEVPLSFLTLNRLLCQQASRNPGDYELAISALQEFEAYVDANDGKAAYHLLAMKARIAVFSRQPAIARELFQDAIELARYAEPNEAEKLLRAFTALCARERYGVPLKNATDTQWLFGLHPLQKRRPDILVGETKESLTNSKRAFDYYRYFPPQSFFDKANGATPNDAVAKTQKTNE